MNKKNNKTEKFSDMWSVVEGDFDGTKIIARIREIKDTIDLSEYPFQIGVTVPFVYKTEKDIPSDQEVDVLNEIEDGLSDLFEEKNDSFMVLVITSNNVREFVFYTKYWKPEVFQKEIKDLNQKFEKYILQFMMREDPEWSTYSEFAD